MSYGLWSLDIINSFWERLHGGDDIYKANEILAWRHGKAFDFGNSGSLVLLE